MIDKIIGISFFLACCCAVFFYGKHEGYEKGYADGAGAPVQHDTIVKVDTVFHDRPVEKWREVEKLVYIPVNDTMVVHTTDTVFVALQREVAGYSGDDYECQVSGVDPALDWIKVFPETKYITNTVVERPRWSFGVAGGPGVMWDPFTHSIHAGLGITAGIQYKF